MLRKLLAAAATASLLTASVPAFAATAGKTPAPQIASTYEGDFLWDGDPAGAAQHITLKISKTNLTPTGVLVFQGTETYEGTGDVKVSGRVIPRTKRVTMQELTKPTAGFVNDGSFTGTVSADGKTLRLTWNTRSTGEKGRVTFQAATAVR